MGLLDFHMWFVILGVACLGGLLALDRTAFGQFMVSQPIVAGPLIGLLLGDTVAGVVIGAALELIWVLDMPIGNFVPANSTISVVSATAIAVLSSRGNASLSVIGFCLLLTTAMVPATMVTERIVRNWNSRLGQGGDAADSQKNLRNAQLSGMAAFFLQAFSLCLIFVPLGIIAVVFFKQLPLFVHRAMVFYVTLLPFLGAALMIRTLSLRIIDICMVAGFVLAALTLQVLHFHVLAVLGLIMLAGWLGGRYSASQR